MDEAEATVHNRLCRGDRRSDPCQDRVPGGSVFDSDLGSAFKQLVPVALGAGGMAEHALALQQKLPAQTRRRGFTANKADTAEDDEERGDGPHGCSREPFAASEKNKQARVSKDAASVQQVRWRIEL
ncbi:hypothetical protein EYF80_044189 [Liparis tanakae]|uniref:Uncharacterized protein n=1 Tax=Liparis tanakae TaxID=230148 RepID=A0A4Z2FXZ2_9TELE|nr:hypothetical protein EYF80_044189 [Liparis tanakae]